VTGKGIRPAKTELVFGW